MSNNRSLKDLFSSKFSYMPVKSKPAPHNINKSPLGLSHFTSFFQMAKKSKPKASSISQQRNNTPQKVKVVQVNISKQDSSPLQINQPKHQRNQSAQNIPSSRNNSFSKDSNRDQIFSSARSPSSIFMLSKLMKNNKGKESSPVKPAFFDNSDIINRNTVRKNSQSPNTSVQKISQFNKQNSLLVKENKPLIIDIPKVKPPQQQQQFQIASQFKFKGFENLFNSIIQPNSRYEKNKQIEIQNSSEEEDKEETLIVDCNIQVNKNSYAFHYVIGKGGFGKVWKVEFKKNRQLFAMKEMSKAKIIAKRSVNSVMNERNLLAQFKHPFLINMNYCFQDRDNLYLVMDLLTGGDLRYHIGKNRRFKEHQTKFFVACVLLVLEYLHNNNVIHRDLKPENLVLDKQGYVRLTDLGIARIWKAENSQDTSGTPGYMAPEVMCRQNHTIAVDYFALGVITYEFMLGRRPYNGRSRQEIRDQILTRQVQIKRSEIPDDWSVEAADFVNKLIQRKPINRLGFKGPDEVKNHPWLRSFPWSKLCNKEIDSPYIPKTIDDNPEYLNQISESNESQDDLIRENKILLKKNSVQNLFSGYSYDQAFSKNTKSTASTLFLA